MNGCPTDVDVLTSNLTSLQSWNEPIFTDPLGFYITVTTNYPTPTYEFPWGEFTVQYSAVKPSNGLRTECTFNITIKRKTNLIMHRHIS